ncbi:hypothetical protein RFI_33436, partial [Reticulomyxa filosa]
DKKKAIPSVLWVAKDRLQSMEKELIKRTREMEMHLKVKEKMFAEVQNVHTQLDQVMKEYKTVVEQLERLRKRHNAEEEDVSEEFEDDESDT